MKEDRLAPCFEIVTVVRTNQCYVTSGSVAWWRIAGKGPRGLFPLLRPMTLSNRDCCDSLVSQQVALRLCRDVSE